MTTNCFVNYHDSKLCLQYGESVCNLPMKHSPEEPVLFTGDGHALFAGATFLPHLSLIFFIGPVQKKKKKKGQIRITMSMFLINIFYVVSSIKLLVSVIFWIFPPKPQQQFCIVMTELKIQQTKKFPHYHHYQQQNSETK